MTTLQVLECITNHSNVTSYEMIYDSNNNINIPRYAVVEVLNDSEKMYHYFHFNERTGAFSMRTFTSDESLYVNHLMRNRTDLLQDMLNSGTLYKNVRTLLRKANTAVDAQTALWAEKNNDVQLTIKNNDQIKYRKLLAGLQSAAQEEIFPVMLYV
ncbi:MULTISPECIES: hypothetical protein [unclassified Ruminococcus]|uniref:hypothetical protein n=1 Tax=unclassified Ruminococcus TaxID=2608920 RepID=UPI00210B8B9C|nr:MULTISPECIES: hypothetical protein [unclassified Ruminococcus]MCQ4021721.1 hypothetical protein [Ruminococcus sp. zg-924]MCQ4114166.1 hypothetical protein [Ruminococcus sp. zg-921]